MLFVLDENFQKNLAAGLDLLEKANPASTIPVTIIAADDFMGRKGATDAEILDALGDKGVLFSKDKDFKQLKLYAKVIEGRKAKVLFFKHSKNMVLFWDMLKELIIHWEKIKNHLCQPSPPYVFQYTYGGGIQICHLR